MVDGVMGHGYRQRFFGSWIDIFLRCLRSSSFVFVRISVYVEVVEADSFSKQKVGTGNYISKSPTVPLLTRVKKIQKKAIMFRPHHHRHEP
jgi:hypothetical protein